jgi:hypothetical protein
MKTFYCQWGTGQAKYVVNYHDGIKTHSDGSEFYDIRIFKNAKDLARFVASLMAEGYAMFKS